MTTGPDLTIADLRVGLSRHAQTERWASGHAAFGTMEQLLSQRCRLALLEPRFPALAWQPRLELGREFLRQLDVAIVPVGPSVATILAIFEARERFGGPPIIYLPLGDLPRGGRFTLTILPYLRPSDRIAVTCRRDRRMFDSVVAVPPCPVCVLPFGVDVQELGPYRARPARPRASFRLGYAGRITFEKNVLALLDVVAGLAQAGCDAELTLLGPVEDQPFFEWGLPAADVGETLRREVARRPALRGRVRLLGPAARAEISRFWRDQDVAINLSVHHDENFGFSNVEASLCGVPVVSSDWGGLADSTVDGVTGAQIPTAISAHGVRCDLYSAIDACLQLAADAEMRDEMGRAGRRHVAERFSHESFTTGLVRVIADAAATDGGGTAPGGHLLSPLGEELLTRFGFLLDLGDALPPRIAGGIPSFGSPAHRDIYVSLLRSYASHVSTDAVVAASTVCTLASSRISVSRHSVRVDEPLYTRERWTVNETDIAVLSTLAAAGPLDIAAVLARMDDRARWHGLRSICQLASNGLVILSPPRQRMSADRSAGSLPSSIGDRSAWPGSSERNPPNRPSRLTRSDVSTTCQ